MPMVKAVKSNITVSDLEFTYTTKRRNKRAHIDNFKLAKWDTIKRFAPQASSLTVFKPTLTSTMALLSWQ